MHRLLEIGEIVEDGDQEYIYNHEEEKSDWYGVSVLDMGEAVQKGLDPPIRRKMKDKTLGKIVKANQDLVMAMKEIHDDADHIIGSDDPDTVFMQDAHSIRKTAKKALKKFRDNIA